MNKKQLIVVWIVGIIISIIILVNFSESYETALNKLINSIGFSIPFLIIGGLIFYSLRNSSNIKFNIKKLFLKTWKYAFSILLIMLVAGYFINKRVNKASATFNPDTIVLNEPRTDISENTKIPEEPILDKLQDEQKAIIAESKSKWRKLEKLMTQSQVRDLLGEPERVETLSWGGQIWYYPNSGELKFYDNVDTLPTGTVTVLKMCLKEWSEPRWDE